MLTSVVVGASSELAIPATATATATASPRCLSSHPHTTRPDARVREVRFRLDEAGMVCSRALACGASVVRVFTSSRLARAHLSGDVAFRVGGILPDDGSSRLSLSMHVLVHPFSCGGRE
jgi:hypothetical protein